MKNLNSLSNFPQKIEKRKIFNVEINSKNFYNKQNLFFCLFKRSIPQNIICNLINLKINFIFFLFNLYFNIN